MLLRPQIVLMFFTPDHSEHHNNTTIYKLTQTNFKYHTQIQS